MQNESFNDESTTPNAATATAVIARKKPDRMSGCARFAIFVFGAGAVAMSVFALYSCDFFSYQALDGLPWEGLNPPFEKLAMASVGMFRYSQQTISGSEVFGAECLVYENWMDIGSERFFAVGQWCAMVAPVLAILTMTQMFCEFLCCRLRGSYMLMQMSFYMASILQMCSFFVLMEKEFCLDAASQNECALEKGAYYSLAAGGAYMLIAVCFSFLKPTKDVTPCGFLGCCIMTRVRQNRAIPLADSEDPQKGVEGDTSEEDDEYHGDRVATAAAVTPRATIDSDDLMIVNYERNTIPVASADPMSPKAGEEDRYSLARDIDLANDSDLNSNPDPSQLTMETTTTDEQQDNTNTNKNKDPPVSSSDAQNDKAASGEVLEAVVVEDTTDHSRRPDFLDMCCGDPLELEKYMTGGKCTPTKGSSSSINTNQAPTAAEEKLARKRSESLRTSLRKIALVTEASNHEKRSLGIDPDDLL